MIAAALCMAEGALLHGPSPASRTELSGQRLPRRDACTAAAAAAAAALFGPAHAHASEQRVRMEGLNGPGKSKNIYPDYEKSDSGLQYKEFKPGSGTPAKVGDRVTLEWTGVTVGYQGRYFETRNKPKGGAFADDGFMQELTLHPAPYTPHPNPNPNPILTLTLP